MASVWTKVDLVQQRIAKADSPFDAEDMAIGCHVSTVYRALDKMRGQLFVAWRVKHGKFYRVFFPMGWTADECRAWLDKRCKSGKSKATLYKMGVGKA